jgi:hypothetical protein
MTDPPDPLLRELFVAALELAQHERQRYLAEHCADPELRAELEALLLSHDRIGTFLSPEEGPLAACWAATIRPGTRLGDFEVVAYHAHGGRGVVYRARQISLAGREVALKVVPLVQLPKDREAHRLSREAALAARVEHRHLVAIHAAGESQELGIAWYAMRFVRGPTLQMVQERLAARGEAPSPAERRTLVARLAEVARACGALHAAGLVHGDIKPSNIMLEDGSADPPFSAPALLVDFGLARSVDAAAPSALAVTLAYAAPERLRGCALEPRVDVFSLALSLFDLLRGMGPMARAGHAPEWIPSLRSFGVDARLAAIVQRASSAEPERRPAHGHALADELEAWLAGERSGVPRLRRLEELRRAVRREPGAWRRGLRRGAFALVILALIAVVTAIAVQWAALQGEVQRGELAAAVLRRARWPALAGLVDEGSASTADVLATLSRGTAAGRRQALAWLDRDGPEAHPVLLRFLSHELRRDPSDGALLRGLALLGLGRPARSERERAAYGGLLDALREELAAEHPGLERAFVAAAMGSLGGRNEIAGLLAFAAEPAHRSAAAVEAARVALEGAAVLLRHAHDEHGPPPERRWLELVIAMGRDAGSSDGRAAFSAARERFAVEWALAMRRAGESPGSIDACRDLAVLDPVRAAFRDEGWFQTLLRRGPVLLEIDVREPAARDVQRAWNLIAFGRLVGLYDEAQAEAPALAAVIREAGAAGFDSGRARELFARGHAEASAQLLGRLAADEPDPDTRLGRLLSAVHVVEPPSEALALAARSLVVVDFAPRPLRFSGSVGQLAFADVALADDEVALDRGFAKLALPGRSRIDLEFECEPASETPVFITLTVQKGSRRRLVHHGHAAVDLLLDGVVTLAALPTPSSTGGPLEVPLAPQLDRGRHRLTIRLASGADTTLRVIALAVYRR